MKVLTVMNPWATLIRVGAKRIETRSYDPKYRGWLLIHASKNMTGEAERDFALELGIPVFESLGELWEWDRRTAMAPPARTGT